jgi:hypothetical protein
VSLAAGALAFRFGGRTIFAGVVGAFTVFLLVEVAIRHGFAG